MANLINKNVGKKLLRQTTLLNGSGKQNLKNLSPKELEKVSRQLPVSRNKTQKS